MHYTNYNNSSFTIGMRRELSDNKISGKIVYHDVLGGIVKVHKLV